MSAITVALQADLEELYDDTAAQLRAIAATLTPVERRALAAEAADGDQLALQVLNELLVVRCLRCGGERWRPAQDGDLERCEACGAPAPFTAAPTSEVPCDRSETTSAALPRPNREE
jgi:hypothetical protein